MKRALLLLLLSIPVLVLAQSNFKRGYILTSSNDTLNGFIDYKERNFNPSTISFKSDTDGKVQAFDVGSCAGYGIYDYETYNRFAITISMSRERVGELTVGRDPSNRRDTVFLKVLQSGKYLALYSYVDALKKRFYIKSRNSQEPVELLKSRYLNPEGAGNLVIENSYRNQLRAEIMKTDALVKADERRITILRYDESDLLSVVSAINEQELIKSSVSRTRFLVGSGLGMSKASYSGNNRLAKSDAKSQISYLPTLTVGIDGFANPAIGKMIYRLDLSLYMSKNKVSAPLDEHSFDQTSVALNPQVIYNFYNSDKIKGFAGLGLGLNLSTYSNNKTKGPSYTIDNQVDLEAFNYSYFVKAGVVYKKLEFSVNFIPQSTLTQYSLYRISMDRLNFGVTYLFGKH